MTSEDLLKLYTNGGRHLDVPMDECTICHSMVPVDSLRKHMEEWHKVLSNALLNIARTDSYAHRSYEGKQDGEE